MATVYKYKVGEMSCASCSAKVEKALKSSKGVSNVNVNLLTGEAVFSADSPRAAKAAVKAVEKMGYPVREDDGSEEDERRERRARRIELITLIVSAVLTLPLLIEMILMLAGVHTFLHNAVLQLVLAALVQFGIGWRFYRSAFKALLSKTLNMDMMVVIGITATFALSVYNGFFTTHGEMYFDGSATIVTLILLGKYLERGARFKTLEAITRLKRLRPATAIRLTETGVEEVSADALRPGDLLLLAPGARAAADGIVESGESEADESMLTGESLPVEKRSGSKIIAGCVNGGGTLEMRVTGAGNDTFLSGVIEAVKSAQGRKAPVQKIADRAAVWLVPSVLLAAAIAFIINFFVVDGEQALIRTASMLLIACPCALGLATPAAVMTATGRAARQGVIYTGGDSLQALAGVNAAALDKTGTLTAGKPKVSAAKFFTDEQTALSLALALEGSSGHILGEAVSEYCAARLFGAGDIPAAERSAYFSGKAREAREKLNITEPESLSGKGVRAALKNSEVFIGKPAYAPLKGVNAALNAQLSELGELPVSLALLTVDGAPAALFALGDELRAEAPEAVSGLTGQCGISLKDIIILSGDAEKPVRAAAEACGIINYRSSLLPADKQRAIAEMKERGLSPLLLGDGVNDAPAMAESAVGVAMGKGTETAVSAAGVILLREDLRLLPFAILLARATVRKIKQNLFWAFFYNLAALPLAAFGILSPVIAAGAMALSSLTVVLSSLLLARKRIIK